MKKNIAAAHAPFFPKNKLPRSSFEAIDRTLLIAHPPRFRAVPALNQAGVVVTIVIGWCMWNIEVAREMIVLL